MTATRRPATRLKRRARGWETPPGPQGALAAAAELPVDPGLVPRMPLNYSL